MSDSTAFDGFNHTELYQACRHAGIVAQPSDSREKLITYLEGEAEPPRVAHEFDRWRHGIMQFLIDHWTMVEPQLTCPAKSKDPLACFQCVDAQVICCVVQNKVNENLIRIRIPKGDS